MSSAVIKIENLWKEYRLGVIGHGTLTHDLQSWWAKMRGKEDPNAKITPMLAGQEKQIEGDRFWALRDINLEVKEGEILGIIGKNGAGKSTLLKILSRVTAPTKGSIKVKGRIASLLEVGTGFHPELTGRENIFMNGAILGMSKQEIKGKLDEIIDFSGVENFIDTPVKRYSSGMYVRLAFAVAAHLEPEILIIDEVLAVGDAEFQKKCLGKMKDVAGQGRTVLFVSHNMAAVRKLCSTGLVMKNGKNSFYGTSSDSTGYYLNIKSCNSEAQREWSGESAPGDSSFKIISFKVFGENCQLRNNFRQDEHIYISFVVDISSEIKKFRINLEVETETSETAFVASSYRKTNRFFKIGKYKITVKIPRNILNAMSYRIFASAGEPNVRVILKSLFLTSIIIENSFDRGASFSERWPGIVAPELEWTCYDC
ncbi:MAG: ATP-binding cassette domain-containing protein [Candidatus Electrothrix sp. AW3_4]|nr:ATP-binding cassette domain-containing protein [Candidatus Electrothrix gigas]